MKTTSTYWNPFALSQLEQWEVIENSDGNLRQLTLAEDPKTGDYTRLTWSGLTQVIDAIAIKQKLTS